jgi:hypothetical protein
VDSFNETYRHWAEAFEIFSRYDQEKIAHVAAAYDLLYAGPAPDLVAEPDRQRLAELGWLPAETGFDCFRKFL